MARLRTLLQLRTSARQLAEQDQSQFVSDAVANDWISQDAALWYGKIKLLDPQRFYTQITINTTAGTQAYALPANFASMLGVDRVSGAYRHALHPTSFQDRRGVASGGELSYHLRGTQGTQHPGAEELVIEPDPGTASYTVHYVRAPAPLVNDTDTVDGVCAWDEWIVYSVAARMALRAEDLERSQLLRVERDMIENHLRKECQMREAIHPTAIANVRPRASYSLRWRR